MGIWDYNGDLAMGLYHEYREWYYVGGIGIWGYGGMGVWDYIGNMAMGLYHVYREWCYIGGMGISGHWIYSWSFILHNIFQYQRLLLKSIPY